MPNEHINFYLPLKVLDPMYGSDASASTSGLSANWALRQYRFQYEDLYVLASVCISDKTFGEMSLHIDRIESIPRAFNLREIQWRVLLLTSEGQQKLNEGYLAGSSPHTIPSKQLKSASNTGKALKQSKEGNDNGIITKHVGERIEYEIECCKELEIDQEVNIHMQFKDIFGATNGADINLEDLASNSLIKIHQD